MYQFAAVYLFHIGTGVFYIKHLRLGRTKDIGIQQTYLIAESCQGYSQVSGNRTFTYASLTGRYGNDIFYLRKQFVRFGACGLACQNFDVSFDVDIFADISQDSCLGCLYD